MQLRQNLFIFLFSVVYIYFYDLITIMNLTSIMFLLKNTEKRFNKQNKKRLVQTNISEDKKIASSSTSSHRIYPFVPIEP